MRCLVKVDANETEDEKYVAKIAVAGESGILAY